MRLDLAIKAGRGLRQMKQRDLAARIGVPRANVSRWERGLLQPTMENIGRIAGALEMSPRALIEAAQIGRKARKCR